MKFGKSLLRVVELSDPEWGPYWINYKFLKKKIREIIESQGGVKATADKPVATRPSEIAKSSCEVEFFLQLKSELKKTSDFFASTEQLYAIRKVRVWEAFNMLKGTGVVYDKNTWSRLLNACVNFYKDVLLLENFAIMNYCGFSKILKKHDKLTGYATRDAFMRNVVNQQNFTHYPNVLKLINQSEKLFLDIQGMESVMPLQDEERLFIEAIRDLNYQASQLQSQERGQQSHIVATTHTNTLERVDSNSNGKTADEVATDALLNDTASSNGSTSAIHGSTCGDGVEGVTSSGEGGADTEESDHRNKKRKTSFNPYHGPSFMNAIPDSSTPYISSMCIIDASDRLDSAMSLVVDAAMRLNHSNSAPLPSILSWAISPSKSKPTPAAPTPTSGSVPATSSSSVTNGSNGYHSSNVANGSKNRTPTNGRNPSPSVKSQGPKTSQTPNHQQHQQQYNP